MPSIIHVYELTQPLGHSTSGSHERYKPKVRLDFELEFDCNRKFREWILEAGIAGEQELDQIQAEEQALVEDERRYAWQAFTAPILSEQQEVTRLLEQLSSSSQHGEEIEQIRSRLSSQTVPYRRNLMAAVQEALRLTWDEISSGLPARQFRQALVAWKNRYEADNNERYGSHLYTRDKSSALNVSQIEPMYDADPPRIYGYEILNACFDAAMQREPRLVAFGEDVGRLGDVNQGFHGLQEKYGSLRVSDTGIREATIVGQAIGLALRGLRPIAEIQYLDYLLYALQILSDDLATLHWRTRGGQKAPVILRTRGHRLEGIWHSGSPMGGIIHLLRGMHVLVPRDMTRAAGFYNTLLLADDPALVVEVLNGYRTREPLPRNIAELTVPLGLPEILRPGGDITLVTYGACCRIVLESAGYLQRVGIDAEVIDVQSLLPFDLQGVILESLQKTGRILFIDEDVPGGATSYMLQQVIETQGGYTWLDSPPRTLSSKPHRPAYGSDGDYFSKPNADQVFDAAYDVMHEADPGKYPALYS
jgi:pyruvate/2-oxoglutarate/acetoin dehydrogenase E1 component